MAVGDNANGANAQTLANLLGKILRINTDGSIPTDNPFFSTATGKTARSGRSACATRSRSRSTRTAPEMFINDVGQNTWEEINDGLAGANYGWPDTEGADDDPRFVSPRYAYEHVGRAAARSPAARSTRR